MRPARLSLAALTLAATLPAAEQTGRPVLPFLEDDYPKAMEQARAKKLPVFVEAWAPW